jgi:predicted ATPase
MMRELADAIEAYTAHVPLILCLEDVHWADSSTIEWIAAAARRREHARLLVVATTRPIGGAERNSSIGEVVDGLRVKALCREIALAGLDERAVEEYVVLHYPPAAEYARDFSNVARLVHAQTRGNPLFVGHVLRDLQARGWFERQPDGWRVRRPIDARDLGVPEDLRRLIERDIERLIPSECNLLEVAAVVGATFSAAAVAGASDAAVDAAESTLGELARRQQFVRESGVSEWPDGTIAAQYDFIHALHRDVLYQRLPAGRRATLHRAVGELLEAAYGGQASDLAAELAMHFDRGHDHARAIVHLQGAAEVARRRGATREAQMHFERALTILERQPDSTARDEREIPLRIGLGSILQVIRGWGAAEVEEAFARARTLCERIGDRPRLFPALWGLWLFYWGRSAMSTAAELSAQLQALASQTNDTALRLQALHAAWATAFSRGRLSEAHHLATQGLALYDTAQHAPTAAYYGNHDAAVCAAVFSARADALTGSLHAAVRTTEWAVSHARELMHPVTLCHALTFTAWVHHLRRNPAATWECAEAALAIARDQNLRLLLAWASVSAGWAEVQQGQHEGGLRRIREAIADIRLMGSEQFLPHVLGMLAETCLSAGQHAQGMSAIDEALENVHRTGERFWEAELHRLKGELLIAAAGAESPHAGAENEFEAAQSIARSQGAAVLELRATVSLARVWRESGREHAAREMISAACALVPEALELPDVRDAVALFERSS